jgi:hypothetical protein
MINFIRVWLADENLQEAQAGRLEYRDVERSRLVLDGEVLVSSEEVEALEQEFGLEKPDLPIEEPFQNWKDLISAVEKRTPESRQLIRYMEDFGYQDLLKIKNEQALPDGTVQVRWDNFLLPTDVAQQAGYKDGADYNRKMFNELLKHAPRTLSPEVFGGRKLMRGAVGSQRELKKRREPMVDHIVAETEDEVVAEAQSIFGVLPEDWTEALIGPNGSRIVYGKDRTAIHLGKSVETIESTEQHKEISRWNRVLQMLALRKDGDQDTYNKAVEEVRGKLEKLKEEATNRYEIVYVTVSIPLAQFFRKLVGELKSGGYEDAGEGQLVAKTTLENLPKLFSLLDPAKVQRGREGALGGRFGMRGDFYDVILGAVMKAFGGEVDKIVRIDASGNIFFTMGAEMPEEEEEDEDYEASLRAVAKSDPESLMGKQAAELLKSYRKRAKTDVEEIADSIEY